MPLGKFVEEDDLTARRLVDINVHGVMYGMKLALPRMQRRNSGHVVNIASQAGKTGFPGGATYCGTKHFVVGVSEAVRAELRGTAIEISCVMPAVVNTELGSGLTETRAVKVLEPEDVASAIVDALERPKFDVFVPRETVAIYKMMNLLPRGAREGIGRFLKADKVLADVDSGVRASYEDRAAHSEPGLEAEEAAGETEAAEAETTST
jgi:short-subunit dehydrogenase